MSISSPSSDATTVDLLRHGEVQTPNLFCAPLQEPLSKHGWAQMQRGSANEQWDCIVSSSSTRCADFAQQLAMKHNLSCHLDDALTELDFGDWIGKARDEVWSQSPDLLQNLWADPQAFVAPNGESMRAFVERINSAWQQCLIDHAGQRVLLISHAGVLRVILAQVLEIDYAKTLRLELAYGARHRLTVYGDGEVTLNFLGKTA